MLTIIQNDADVPLGTFSNWLEGAGVGFRLVRACDGEPLPLVSEVRAVIMLGGAMGVHDTDKYPFLIEVKKFMAECLARDVPYLGICLGGQLLADVAGAEVTSNRYGEKGIQPIFLTEEGSADPLFRSLPADFITFQWHGDSFAIPAGGVHLAGSQACPNQAFRLGRAYGLQFHPEVNAEIVAFWSRETPETEDRVSEFLQEFEAARERYAGFSRQLLLNFLQLASLS